MTVNEEYGYLIVDGEVAKTGYIDLTDVINIITDDIDSALEESTLKAIQYIVDNWTTKTHISLTVTDGRDIMDIAVFRSVV